jgi:hypothetical protein
MKPYNSALKDYHSKIEYTDKVKSFIHDLGMGFIHDVVEGIPSVYNMCDTIYFENFWLNGHKTLCVKYSFEDLQRCLNYNINEYKGRVFLVTGKSCLKYFDGYSKMSPVYLHNYESICLQWNSNLEFSPKFNNYQLIEKIVTDSNYIGDIMCGYGNTVLECIKQGKRFICSDISEDCISITNQQIINYEKDRRIN